MNNNLKSYSLDNGLKIIFFDKSKEIAANLSYICIILRIIVPIKKEWFNKTSLKNIKFEDILDVLGKKVVFEQKYEKHFVKKSLKKVYISEMIDNILKSYTGYLGSYKFPIKLILNRFAEKQ